jgi:MoaA/NifB/PqqE/SkfB family radical SAM enzyme
MDSVRLVSRLATNALRYRLLKVTGRPTRLEALSLEITHRCICRCRMCNIWQIPQTRPDLPLSTWIELLSAADLRCLREIDITGGEPFLRQDLPELLVWICRAKAAFFPHLKTLAVTTNGILTGKILEVVTGILPLLQEQEIDLVLACGLDAIGSLHDRIRKFPGAWGKLETTLLQLTHLRETNPRLVLGIKTTIIPANVIELERIAAFAQALKLFTIISPRIITPNRFGNVDLEDDLEFSHFDRQKIAAFYLGLDRSWSGHRQTLLDFFRTGLVSKPCSAGFNTLFVRHNGEVFPCPVIAASWGNITRDSLDTLLGSARARSFRRAIGSFSECKTCTEPGLERIAWPFEGLTCLGRLTQMGYGEFSRLICHMGLDKYL